MRFVFLFFLLVVASCRLNASPLDLADSRNQKVIFHADYERMTYVAEKLGLLRPPVSTVEFEWQQIIQNYKIPASAISGFLLGYLVYMSITLLRSYNWIEPVSDESRCWVISTLFSLLLAYAVFEFFQVHQNYAVKTFLYNLENFFQDWVFNKDGVPMVLLPLFQELYELYLMYGRKLPLHPAMIEELRRIIMYHWMRGVKELVHAPDCGNMGDHVSVGFGSTEIR